jgi:uncharacterized protein (TIGR02271 family)
MANAVVAVFDGYDEAQSTVNELLSSGFNMNEVRLNEGDVLPETRKTARPGSVKGFFQNLFGTERKEEDIRLYDEAVRHGNYVVTAIAENDSKSELASEVMSHHHPIDIDERASEWLGTTRESAAIPVVQEEVKIGKREVERGGVRVFKRVTEIPVEEDVTLREERVVVERVPVNKPATEADLSTFKDGSVEFRERGEEAVVAKTARVVEEVRVGKEVGERKERIKENVRRTGVEVERTGPDRYRAHWQENYSRFGGSYEDYAPAYEYGERASTSAIYQNRSWDQVEPELRTDWEARYPDSTWERFKESIRHAFGRKTLR